MDRGRGGARAHRLADARRGGQHARALLAGRARGSRSFRRSRGSAALGRQASGRADQPAGTCDRRRRRTCRARAGRLPGGDGRARARRSRPAPEGRTAVLSNGDCLAARPGAAAAPAAPGRAVGGGARRTTGLHARGGAATADRSRGDALGGGRGLARHAHRRLGGRTGAGVALTARERRPEPGGARFRR